jgi:hypothetical protein
VLRLEAEQSLFKRHHVLHCRFLLACRSGCPGAGRREFELRSLKVDGSALRNVPSLP